MKNCILTAAQIARYARALRTEERAPATIEKYLRDVRSFAAWLEGRPVSKELAARWKEGLLGSGLAPATVNAKLSALNGLFRFLGWEDCRVRFLKLQRRAFRDPARDLTREEYGRLLETANRQGRGRLALLLETICAAGLRVSEVRCITAEAVLAGRAEIRLKGKIRTILLPGKLCRKLLKYAKKQKIASGEIFLTRSGKAISRRQIWHEVKALCGEAKVAPSKVFPHNLRHLFAAIFYRATRDIVKLADVLGHSSINTTRIYLLSTGEEHVRQLDRMGLVS
ncbi:MAG: tyrosine-type recombinase/integrase [Oscillospiraceae bacterium]|jgi:integrase/recombinase XerD|nr:tyrosine-type recombinase/integrase [Oscillospiraceae bacterium]